VKVYKIAFVMVLLLCLTALSYGNEELYLYGESYLDSMTIELEPGSDRPFLYSGIGNSFYYGTTKAIADVGWMGFHWGPYKLFDDFILNVDGETLDRSDAKVFVQPHQILFKWNNGIELTIQSMGVIRNDLMFTLRGANEDSQLAFFLIFPSEMKLDAAVHKTRTTFQTYALSANQDTVGVLLASEKKFSQVQMRQSANLPTGKTRKLDGKEIHGVMFEGEKFDLLFTYGRAPMEMANRLNYLIQENFEPLNDRRKWVLNQINRSAFRCENDEVNKAVNWAKVSLASLYSDDEKQLWAGLPWFNDCWARDTFISLPGAALVLGKYSAAKKILLSFSEWQNKDESSPDYGKMPNRARFGDLIYNTADGTPWFVRELYEYGLYSGDIDLWNEMMKPGGVVERSIEGTIKYRIDKNGFLVHGDADTWMDAKGPEGAWSPRGDRAVEIQVLWLTQLETAVIMAKRVAGKENDPRIDKWNQLAEKLRKNIPLEFVREDGLGLYDHINAGGSKDTKIRPNQLWAVTVPNIPVISPEVEERILSTVHSELVYEYGVASLAQSDVDFHPYHHTREYAGDAAYHMGIVWTWLSGPYKSAVRGGYGVARNEINQLLNWGVPGTISENLDAVPREGNSTPELSGTVSQAWTLAEFLRTWYQDYIGLKPASMSEKYWEIDPRIPKEWGNFTTILDLAGTAFRFDYERSGDEIIYSIEMLGSGDERFIRFLNPENPVFSSWINGPVRFNKENRKSVFVLNDIENGKVRVVEPEEYPYPSPFYAIPASEESYLEPKVAENLKSLAPPPYPLLSGAMIKADSKEANVIFDISDPIGDDKGTMKGHGFGYPSDPLFKPGILDIKHFTMKADEAFVFFELEYDNLVDPGWHDNYGYQLTFTNIAIQTGEKGRKKSQNALANSNFKLNKKYKADRFIFVGGGFEIRDAKNNVLAEHRPDEAKYAMGNVANKTVTFAVPVGLIGGKPEDWKISVLVGAQDDHGGAGVGEFRAVNEEGGRWTGSGGFEGGSNVYDIMIIN